MGKAKNTSKARRIVVLNPKGGSGKTTLAFNLAGYLASTGRSVALIDMDRQGSSTRWLSNRPAKMPPILGICPDTTEKDGRSPASVPIPEHIDCAVFDAPAGLTGPELVDYTCGAHAILVPVMPSDLDIHAASRLISDLLLVAQVSRRNGRLGVIANRVKERTIAYRQLRSFLSRLTIGVIAVLRDSQNYAWAAALGLGMNDMPKSRVGKDLEQWAAVTDWLESRLAQPLNARDLRRPEASEPAPIPRKKLDGMWTSVAASLLLAALATWWFAKDSGPVPETSIAMVSGMAIEEQEQIAGHEGELIDAAATTDPIAEEAPSPAAMIKKKWQLDGVAKIGDEKIVILRDQQDNSTRQVVTGQDVDGWIISDAGADYAVLALDGAEVRLDLEFTRKL